MPISQKDPLNKIVVKFLMSVLFICFENLNLHYGLVKFFKLTTEGVESNPEPWVFDKKGGPSISSAWTNPIWRLCRNELVMRI